MNIKLLFWAAAILIGFYLTYLTMKNESEQFDYAVDAMGFLPSWQTNQDYSIACRNEGVDRAEESVEQLSVDQIVALVKKGFNVCIVDGYIGVPVGIGRALFEAARIPVNATIPYELAKSALESEKPKRCSDYIKPLIYNCPLMLKPYMSRVTGQDKGKPQ